MANSTLNMTRGDTRSAVGTMVSGSLNGASLTFSAKGTTGRFSTISKTIGSGITITSPTTFRVDFLPSDTLKFSNQYQNIPFAVRLTSGSTVVTIVSGTIALAPTV